MRNAKNYELELEIKNLRLQQSDIAAEKQKTLEKQEFCKHYI